MISRRAISLIIFLALLNLAPLRAPGPLGLDGNVARAAEGPQELEAFQGYLEAAPMGMDVRHAWSFPGGRGENVKIIDIEYNWNIEHNDLLDATSDLLIHVRGTDPSPEQNVNHGTAVLGELVAADDGIGITGIANKAKIGLINPLISSSTQDVASAIRRAIGRLEAGDVIVLELQSTNGPRFEAQTGRGMAPIEIEPPVFDAVRDATNAGIIVVESAANGFEDLDHPAYLGLFNRAQRDSGAIIVGAGWPEGGVYGPGPDLTRVPECNYGSRVDVQGWGRFVTTCGYGDIRHEQGPNNWYTIDFGATSSATAMVAGACAILQSIVKERGRPPLSPRDLRRLLVSTGTLQQGDLSEHIGPRPNLLAAIAALDAPLGDGPIITNARMKGAKLVVDGDGFRTNESVIEIDGSPVTKLKYPSDFRRGNGTTTRIMTKKDVTSLLPPGQQVLLTVFIPGSNQRSDPFPFTR